MGVRILKARVKRLAQFPELEACTFVYDDGEEASEDAVLDLLRRRSTVERVDAMPPVRIDAESRSRGATVH